MRRTRLPSLPSRLPTGHDSQRFSGLNHRLSEPHHPLIELKHPPSELTDINPATCATGRRACRCSPWLRRRHAICPAAFSRTCHTDTTPAHSAHPARPQRRGLRGIWEPGRPQRLSLGDGSPSLTIRVVNIGPDGNLPDYLNCQVGETTPGRSATACPATGTADSASSQTGDASRLRR